ncbi:hypothetical protein C922_05032 [Plasmodium inui San Antonio 1]|uniref:Uncharacterized protein n=1 Tax=Plasmodium inui San Antonio 1 TaxID=1237626 RepID=W6ZV28_9APIC|nr:hypothetical protein C922_05032 [Plasmodium inui San Antonio 1]EUD64617.1 hypothetical protein C922_05032 [Plasmodium inui San Antonio 1]
MSTEIYYKSDNSSAIGKSWIEKQGKNNLSAATAGRVLEEDEEVIAEQRNAFLKEKLIGLIEDGQEDNDDNLNFAKRFNALVQEENFQKGLNSSLKDEKRGRGMNPSEYDDIVKLPNTFNFNESNKNLKKDVNLIEFEDSGEVQNFQKLNEKPAKQTNPFTVPDNLAEQNSSQDLYSESTRQLNTFPPNDDFGKLHNSINVNRQSTNKPAIITPTDDFGKLHNSINVNKHPWNKPAIITPTDDFGKLYNSINVNRPPVKKPTIIRPVDGFGEQKNSQDVNKQPTKQPKLIDPTEDFAKLHNSLSCNMPNEKTSNVYRDNDHLEKRYNTLKDDFYSEKLFNDAHKTDNYESKDGNHELQYLYDESRKNQNHKNDFIIYVLNYYEKNYKPPKREELKKVSSQKDYNGESRLSLLKRKRKGLTVWIMKMLNKCDKIYEQQMLSLFSSMSDKDENDSENNRTFIHKL